MLVAEKQLLDANLRNELQVLRRLELKMLVNRYANAIPTATMIGGFTFTGVVELDLLDPQYVDHDDYTKLVAGLFHVFAALALSTAVYALSVSSIAIVLGQRLAIQATATQTVRHEKNVRELANKFTTVLFALGVSLASVVGATICAIWARYSGEVVSAVVATCVFAAILPIVIWGVYTLNARLNDTVDETSTVNLTYEKGHLGTIPHDIFPA